MYCLKVDVFINNYIIINQQILTLCINKVYSWSMSSWVEESFFVVGLGRSCFRTPFDF